MEKISRILPSTNRVVAAEIADAQPVRPGAPAFGRPMGKNSLGDRITLSKKAMEAKLAGEIPNAEVEKPLTYKNNSESAKLKLIDKLSKDFFNTKIEARGSDRAPSELALKTLQDTEELGMQKADAEEISTSQAESLAPLES